MTIIAICLYGLYITTNWYTKQKNIKINGKYLLDNTFGRCSGTFVLQGIVNVLPWFSNYCSYIWFRFYQRVLRESTTSNLEQSNDILLSPGPSFTNDFSPAIQIWWKIRLAVIPLLAASSHKVFAHATTAKLSYHVQNSEAITALESRWEWNKISIEFGFQLQNGKCVVPSGVSLLTWIKLITYSFQNSNGPTVEVLGLDRYFMQHIIVDVIIYLCWI